MEENAARHEPVMLRECLEYLALQPGATVVDATLGLGGHSLELMRQVGPEGTVVGLDRDPEALRRATARLGAACAEWGWERCPLRTAHTDFRDFGAALDELGIREIHGALFDLGVSSMQLDLPDRGFSFRASGPLDMRMNTDSGETAADLVNTLPEEELARILWEFGEERYSRRIARRILERRPLTTTKELEDAVWGAYPPPERRGRIHPATRTFQALRIAVNDELAALEPAVTEAVERMASGGRVVVMSYHSLEDRIIKRAFEFLSGRCRCPVEVPVCVCGAQDWVKIITRKPIQPTEEEIERNPRARSARLRVAEKR